MVDLTIITAHYNDIPNLLKTYNSILEQSFDNWKLYIIDSFTPNIYKLLNKKILNDPKVTLFQVESGIYDAINFGILISSSKYFQILNCGTTYSTDMSLINSMRVINDIDIKKGSMVHFFEMEIISKDKKVYLNKPSKFIHPLKCGHESTIFPNRSKDKIIHHHNYKLAADLGLIMDYSDLYSQYFHKTPLVKYPKGGYSDTEIKVLDKTINNFIILKEILLRFKLIAAFYMVNRLLKDILRMNILKIFKSFLSK